MSLDELHVKIREISQKLGIENPPRSGQNLMSFAELSSQPCTLIKSDNLIALEWLLTQSIEVDFCYIDPPYNTGSKFVYHDARSAPTNTIWARHHDWLAFMLPRLTAAQMLLKKDGVIAISIDDYEYAYLKILMDNIFGESNFIASLVVCRSKNGKGGRANVAVNHEYVLVYGKSAASVLSGLEDTEIDKYDKVDKGGRYKIDGLFRKKGDASRREDRPNMFYPLYYSETGEVFTSKEQGDLKEAWPIDSKGIERRWLWGKEKATLENWKLYASPGGVIYVKNYSTLKKRIKIRSILSKDSYLNDRATSELKKIFDERIFETPKPLNLIKDLIDCCSADDAVVLDFFAGSGTTAHALQMLNAETSSSRRCILVEQKQEISETHIAVNRGFKNIADITEFRLSKIKQDFPGFEFQTIEL